MTELSKKRSYDESSREPTLEEEKSPGYDANEDRLKSPHSRERTDNAGDWQLVERGSRKKSRKGKTKPGNSSGMHDAVQHHQQKHQGSKASNHPKSNKPVVTCSEFHKLNSSLRLADLQQLILYCLADGVSPQWLSVRHHNAVRRAVIVQVPGLEKGMFTGDIKLHSIEQDGPVDRNGDDTNVYTASDRKHNGNEAAVSTPLSDPTRNPDQYLPLLLERLDLQKSLQSLSTMFEHVFPINAPGHDNRIHSPVGAILTAPIPKSAEDKNFEKNRKGPKPPRLAADWKNNPTPIVDFISTTQQLLENDYILHPSLCSSEADRLANKKRREHLKATTENGWKDAKISGEEAQKSYNKQTQLDARRRVLAIDCEMVKIVGPTPDSDPEYALARISIRDWDHKTVLDSLVKPSRPVVDYVTQYSGITEAKLAPITTTLSDIQAQLLDIFTPNTILVGHSLDSDIRAFKVTHPFIVDTSIIYPHPRGPPMKSSLKWLSQKYLGREIQKHTGGAATGHDSIEDADACLDLAKEKCAHGPAWGTSEASGESIFKRLSRTPRPGVSRPPPGTELDKRDGRTGAVVDHGNPGRGIGGPALISIGCTDDDEIVAGIRRCVHGDADGAEVPGGGVDLTFARMRELEARRGFAEDSAANLVGPGGVGTELSPMQLAESVGRTVGRIREIYDSLPPSTLFIVYSGVGDPREMRKLLAMQRQFREEYKVKKWDEIEVKWTDTEEQALKSAVRQAKSGVGFVTVT